MTPRAAVVVPTCRRPDRLGRCLDALEAQRFDRSAYELIVVDDADDGSTRRLVEACAARSDLSIRYLAVVGTHGPAAARNLGWRSARGEIVAFTDDDCLPDPDWLASGVAALDGGADAATGRVVVPLPESPTDYERDAAGLEGAEFVTANVFCRRDPLAAVGGFDERFAVAWREDSDLHFALLERGFRVVRAPAAVVVHPVRPARWGVSLAQQRKSQFDALLYKNHPSLYRRGVRSAPPWDYYASVAATVAAAVGVGLGSWPMAATAALVWACLTGEFCLRRLRTTTRRPSHVAEMVVTSAVIPFLSVFWRLYGAWKFRVLFL